MQALFGEIWHDYEDGDDNVEVTDGDGDADVTVIAMITVVVAITRMMALIGVEVDNDAIGGDYVAADEGGDGIPAVVSGSWLGKA